MIKKIFYNFVFILFAVVLINAQTVEKMSDTVMILPFENKSKFENPTDNLKFNWVGESFASSLSDLLAGKWQQPVVNGKPNFRENLFGFNVISNDERKIIQQKLNVPLTSIPSLATSLILARKAKVSKLVIGSFSITNEVIENKEIAVITAKARIIDVNLGIFDFEKNDKGEALIDKDGKRTFREIVINRALTELQSVEGEVAYQILLKQKVVTIIQNEIVKASNKVPARAFEAYIKSLLSPETETRENYLKNAMRIYAEDEKTKGGVYAEAALELGHFYLNQKKNSDAIDYFSRVPAESPQYAEAAFYTGLNQWQQNNYEQALAVLRPLAEDLKLTSVYTTIGAIGIEASRAAKKDKGKSASLLNEGLVLLKRAVESAPEEMNARFNYGVGLFLSGNFAESAAQLRPVLAANPRDGESYYLLAKALEQTKDAAAADFDNQARRFLIVGNKYANLEKEWQSSQSISGVNVRVQQPPRKDFVSVVLVKKQPTAMQTPLNETETLLAEARALYKNGNDDEAMGVLRRVLVSEPMSAEAYLLLGSIHLRRGDKEQAVSSLKTALFWDNRLVNAHVALGKIYLEKGDCLQAKNYAASATAVDKENQDAIGLERQVERCGK